MNSILKAHPHSFYNTIPNRAFISFQSFDSITKYINSTKHYYMFASIYIFHKIYQMDFLKNNHILVSIFLTINSIKKIYINNNLYTFILLLFFKFSYPKSYSFLLFSLR